MILLKMNNFKWLDLFAETGVGIDCIRKRSCKVKCLYTVCFQTKCWKFTLKSWKHALVHFQFWILEISNTVDTSFGKVMETANFQEYTRCFQALDSCIFTLWSVNKHCWQLTTVKYMKQTLMIYSGGQEYLFTLKISGIHRSTEVRTWWAGCSWKLEVN